MQIQEFSDLNDCIIFLTKVNLIISSHQIEDLQVEALIVDHYSGRRCQKDWDEPTNKDLKAGVPKTVQAHSYLRIKGSALGFHGDVNTDWLSDQIQ